LVRQATEKDTSVIEQILLDAVRWMDAHNLPQWSVESVHWRALSAHFHIGDFCIAYSGNTPVACMALIDYDPFFWPDVPKGESLFLHKVAVLRAYAGHGFSKELIDFAKAKAKSLGIQSIRLDSRADRPKVRDVYERNGFVCVAEKLLFGKGGTAFYVCENLDTK